MLTYIQNFINNRVNQYSTPYVVFGIFGILNYPLSYLYHISDFSDNKDSFIIRAIATILCFLLVIKDRWPTRLKPFLPIYWYCTVIYCLPVIGTYLLLVNKASLNWLMNDVLGLFLLVLLVDWLMFIISLIIGIIIGIIMFWFIGGIIEWSSSSEITSMALYMYAFAIILGSLFSLNHQKIYQDRLSSMKMLSGTIAHEMRTPLASIKGLSRNLEKALPVLCNCYEFVRKSNQDVPTISGYANLQNMPTTLQKISNSALVFIDMLLIKLKESPEKEEKFQEYSVVEIVENAINEYPLEEHDIKLINFDKTVDFKFKGNELLMTHVLFNLLKNALYFIKSEAKGDIQIWAEQGDKVNRLYFKDTGKGIPKNILANIFNKFSTNTKYGTGVGLAFCKDVMKSLGGNIKCNSVEGEYAEFILVFPKEFNNNIENKK